MSALIDRQPTTEIVFLIYRKDFFFPTRIVHTALCRISQILNDAGSFPFASFSFSENLIKRQEEGAKNTTEHLLSLSPFFVRIWNGGSQTVDSDPLVDILVGQGTWDETGLQK